MKVCITSKGSDKDSLMEERFGRSPYFLIFNTDSDEYEAIKSDFAGEAGGVGPRAVQFLVSHDVKEVMSGGVGGNAKAALVNAGITFYNVSPGDTVAKVYEKYKSGSLIKTF